MQSALISPKVRPSSIFYLCCTYNYPRTKNVHTLRKIYNMQLKKEGRMVTIEIVLYKTPNPDLRNGPDTTKIPRISFAIPTKLDAGRRTCYWQILKDVILFWRWDDGAIERLVAKDFQFFVHRSSWVARCSGTVKIILLRIMLIKTPLLKSSTWRRIYLRNASDDYRPMRIIM